MIYISNWNCISTRIVVLLWHFCYLVNMPTGLALYCYVQYVGDFIYRIIFCHENYTANRECTTKMQSEINTFRDRI